MIFTGTRGFFGRLWTRCPRGFFLGRSPCEPSLDCLLSIPDAPLALSLKQGVVKFVILVIFPFLYVLAIPLQELLVEVVIPRVAVIGWLAMVHSRRID